MEAFVNNIESKIYPLSRIDTMLSVRYTRFVFFYRNSSSSNSFMSAANLEEAFYRTALLFPMIAGYLQQNKVGNLEVVVDKTSLNLPRYCELQSDTHYDDLAMSNYSPRAWPSDITPADRVPLPDKDTGVIKIADIRVARLKENSGVVISTSFNHAVIDGTGCLEFFNRWANETRALASGSDIGKANYCFDREAIKKNLSDEHMALDGSTLAAYADRSFLGDSLASLSPRTRAKLWNDIERQTPIRGHLFRIKRGKLDSLRAQVLECMPPGARISSNDILTALAYAVHGLAEADVSKSKKGWAGRHCESNWKKRREHYLCVPVDMRYRLGLMDTGYIGNPLLSASTINSLEYADSPMTIQKLADTASQVRAASILMMTPPYISAFFDMMESASSDTSSFISVYSNFRLSTMVSNLSLSKLYAADFGSGVQAFSTIPTDYGLGIVGILPSPPPCKDFLVNFSASALQMDSILRNDFWMDIASLVY
ncbi:hypothetical protein DL89DRAFT_266894 [Linderina pennispora]|uniref:Transferase-domain-containing protein n=1 Tax=Linderina pennispora TaxID=61395 RepID=A0A1Y1WBQ4_9FUNG|nr:uncharacterized protein DL89DRAFT_266894 [Linderina pennispora]ORX70748.1 hypothetical protein DL89DRAFT_266894 [Linderina pennispora]